MPDVGPTPRSGGVDYGNTVFTNEKDKGVTADDFLKLMVAQLQNQDFMNPVDDTQYVSQLAQFATMQQMQELAAYSKQSYVMSLVGKTVTAARFKVNGEIESVTGMIDKISLLDNDYMVYIGDKSFSLDQIMELGAASNPNNNQIDYSQSNFLLSLMGQTVTVETEDGTKQEGVVERISMQNGLQFMVDGTWYGLDSLISINQAEEPEEPGETPPEETDPTPPAGGDNENPVE